MLLRLERPGTWKLGKPMRGRSSGEKRSSIHSIDHALNSLNILLLHLTFKNPELSNKSWHKKTCILLTFQHPNLIRSLFSFVIIHQKRVVVLPLANGPHDPFYHGRTKYGRLKIWWMVKHHTFCCTWCITSDRLTFISCVIIVLPFDL